MDVRVVSHLVPINVRDGKPLCPCHQEPMVERAEKWMCADAAALYDDLAALLDQG